MNSQNLIGDNSLEFLKQYKTESEILSLLSGEQIPIQKYFLHFDPWKGDPIPNTYNGKAVIDWNGKPVFAELAVLRLFQSHGWDGVWVDSYRRKYRTGLPDVAEPVKLPEAQQKIIDAIRAKIGKSGIPLSCCRFKRKMKKRKNGGSGLFSIFTRKLCV